MNDKKTRDWLLFEAGKKYNSRLNPPYNETVDANTEFYAGNQWRGLDVDTMPTPVFNIIKRVIQFQVAQLISSKVKLHFEPLLNANVEDLGGYTDADIANAMTSNLFDKFKIDFRIKDALTDGANTGDYCAHFYFDVQKQPYGSMSPIRGEIVMELVDGTNVFFGNANNPNTEVQPYIIIAGRDMVKNLQEEAKRHSQKQTEINAIQEDKNYQDQSSDNGKIEVEADGYGKAQYIIVYRKEKVKEKQVDEFGIESEIEKDVIFASKCVESAYIFKDVQTDLSHYPVSWSNWERQKNSYHGRALTTGILPNQIYINRQFAMIMYHLMMTAFPKAVYNADLIDVWNNEIGAAIGISGAPMEAPIKNVAGYLEPGNMSNQIIQTIELAMSYTKEMLGVSDAGMGQIDPKNTSAIIAVQKASAIPLENPKALLYEWVEDIGRILFDMMGTYYGKRPLVMEIEGQKQIVTYDFSKFKQLWMNVKADVGESSYWSEIATLQSLDKLLEGGFIEFIDYLERIPDEYIPQKQELISKIQEQMMMQQQMANSPEAAIAALSEEEQRAFYNASPEQREAILAQLQQPQAPMPM